jgi:hypothetical protein
MRGWLAGIGGVVLAGVLTFWLTEGFGRWHRPRGPERVEETYDFSMVGGLNRLSGPDCEMDTDPQDTVTVNFSSEISHSESEVSLGVTYDATEYKGNGTKIGKEMAITIYKAPRGKRIMSVEHEGASTFNISNFGAQGRHWGFRTFDSLTAGSYWDTLQFKVDDEGGNDCAAAGVKGTVSYSVILSPEA